MAAELVIAPDAAQDLDEAYGWYESHRVGLGEEFLSCVEACVQEICRFPEMFVKVHKGCRRSLEQFRAWSLHSPPAPSPRGRGASSHVKT